jgi:hypothetical protein
LKSAAASVPFLTLALVTAFLLICGVPTERLGRISVPAAWLIGAEPKTATRSAVAASAVGALGACMDCPFGCRDAAVGSVS